MKRTSAETPQALQALCRLAGEQAAGSRSGLTASATSVTTPTWSQRKGLLRFGLIGGASLLGLAVLAAQFSGEPTFTDAPAPADTAAAAPAARSPWAAPVEPGLAEPVRWQGDDLVVDLDQVPLPEAVSLLARATQSTVLGAHLLHQQVPVTMRWRFIDVATAWKQLLQGHAGYSLSCGGSRCQVWITSVGSAANGADATAEAERPLDGEGATPQGKTKGAAPTELEISQPDGSC